MSTIAVHKFNSIKIGQREDGYMDATAMCQANGKKFNDYSRLGTTQEFLEELSRSTGIPADLLIQKISTGKNEDRGTWVHPLVASNLGQWCSAPFAVFVAVLLDEWRKAGQPDFRQPQQQSSYDREIYKLELELKLEEVKLEREQLKLNNYPQSAPPPEQFQPKTSSVAVLHHPRRSMAAKLQAEADNTPLSARDQHVLSVMSPSKALTATEVAELTGRSRGNINVSLVLLWRKKLVHRTVVSRSGSVGWHYVYYKVETAR